MKDSFERLKFQLNEKLKTIEVMLREKNKLYDATSPKEVIKFKKLEKNIGTSLDELNQGIKEMEMELKAQKKKPKKYRDIDTKEKILKLLKEKIRLLRAQYEGEEIGEEEIKDNRTALQQLDDLLQKRKNMEGYEERELSPEEREKIEEWKKRTEEQDKKLDVIHEGVKELKHEVKKAGEGIDDIGRAIKKESKKITKTEKKVKSQNQRLKELIGKIRAGNKFCVDIILILILLGLIMVLYSVIKHKYDV